MDLQLKEDYPIGKTYIHVNGKKSSQIDSTILTLSHFTFGTQRFSDDTVLDLPSADVFCSSIISAVTVRRQREI
jgi:hypothetical protein